MAEQGDNPDLLVARIAEHQHGVVSIHQLRRAGLSDDAVLGRTRRGWLHRLHRGVYAVGHSGASRRERLVAAILAVGGDVPRIDRRTVLDQWRAALSHRAAAELWGMLPNGGGPIDVSIPSSGSKRRRWGVRLHRCRSLSPNAVTLCDGIPVTTPARTIADLRRVVSESGERRVVSPEELRRAVRQANVLELQVGDEGSRDRTRSDLEALFLRLCRSHRLPEPEVNVRIGSFLVDFLWRDQRLVVETDGYRYHRGHVAFEADRARDLQLRMLGYDVVRLSYSQVSNEPENVMTLLRAALRISGSSSV